MLPGLSRGGLHFRRPEDKARGGRGGGSCRVCPEADTTEVPLVLGLCVENLDF